jgi:hypothetical protein
MAISFGLQVIEKKGVLAAEVQAHPPGVLSKRLHPHLPEPKDAGRARRFTSGADSRGTQQK